jgi:hypothetical protein
MKQVQVTKLVEFTQYNTISKIIQSTLMHFATCVRSVTRLYSCTDVTPPVGIGHVHVHFFASNDLYYDLAEYWLLPRDNLYKMLKFGGGQAYDRSVA